MKNSALSLRLEDALADKLEWLSKRFKVPEAQIIRWAIEALWDYTKTQGDQCMMPINFTKLFASIEKVSGTPAIQDSIRLNEETVAYEIPATSENLALNSLCHFVLSLHHTPQPLISQAPGPAGDGGERDSKSCGGS